MPDMPTNDALYMCVLTKKELHIYSSEGDAFSVALPFAARRMWELGTFVCKVTVIKDILTAVLV